MPKQVRLRRGTTAQHATFTGAEGEVTFDTTKKCLVTHDGVTAGGRPVNDWVSKSTPAADVTQEIESALRIKGGLPSGEVVGLEVDNQVILYSNLTVVGMLSANRINLSAGTLAYAATVEVDFLGMGILQRLDLAGNVTVATKNLWQGAYRIVRVKSDGSARNLTWPGGWRWIGSAAPASIAANKLAMLELWSLGTLDSDVMAKWTVEP